MNLSTSLSSVQVNIRMRETEETWSTHHSGKQFHVWVLFEKYKNNSRVINYLFLSTLSWISNKFWTRISDSPMEFKYIARLLSNWPLDIKRIDKNSKLIISRLRIWIMFSDTGHSLSRIPVCSCRVCQLTNISPAERNIFPCLRQHFLTTNWQKCFHPFDGTTNC